MGNGLTIPVPLNWRSTEGGTEKGSCTACWIRRGKCVGGARRKIRGPIQRRDTRRRHFVRESVIPCFRENPRRESFRRPYRKPTQVGGESIPRRLREPWLRNSAT